MQKIILVFLLLFWVPASAQNSFQLERLQGSNSPSSAYDVVFVGDGFLEKDRSVLKSRAQETTRRLLSVSPFSENRSGVNVYLLYTFSQPGQKFGEADFRYGSTEISRNRVKVTKPDLALQDARSAVPGADLVVLLTRKTGRSHGRRDLVVLSENGQDTIVHEVGHALGSLGDEYESTTMTADRRDLPSGRDIDAPNVTLDEYIDPTNADTIAKTAKWGHFLALPDAFPLVSAYQGGYYRSVGVWRPSFRCIMRSSQGSSFCPVCHEEMTRRLYGKLGKRFDHDAYHRSHPLSTWK